MIHGDLEDFIRESNRIEGIHRAPTEAEIAAHERVMDTSASAFNVKTLEDFVAVVAPGKKLRERSGMNARIGSHIAPRGGPEVLRELKELLDDARRPDADPYKIHCRYETLHPFMDGNGRSGRVLWLWMMIQRGDRTEAIGLGFLHNWYYQSLDALGR